MTFSGTGIIQSLPSAIEHIPQMKSLYSMRQLNTGKQECKQLSEYIKYIYKKFLKDSQIVRIINLVKLKLFQLFYYSEALHYKSKYIL